MIADIRRLLLLLLLDAALFAGIVAGSTANNKNLLKLIQVQTGLNPQPSWLLLIVIIIVLAAPFFLGVLRLGVTLAELVLPAAVQID